MVDHEARRRTFPSKALSPGVSFLGMSAKRVERTDSSLTVMNHQYSIFVQEYSLISEFNLLKHLIEPGVYVIPAAKTPFIWFGVIFIRNGLYEGGIFRFRLFIPHTFPQSTVCPKLIFETPVFHPYINPSTAELNLCNNSLFSKWKKDTNHLWQLIDYARNIFCNISTHGAVNKEAANLYDTNREEFCKTVRNCVENSKVRIYEKPSDDDPHYLIFDEYNSEIHQPYREMLLKNKHHMEDEMRSVSWVQPGSLEPLSRHE